LPLADAANITLMHVVPGDLPWNLQRSAERDAKKALAGEARHLAKSLPRKVSIESVVTAGAAATEIAARGQAVNAELIVMGRRGGRPVRDALLGSTAERVAPQGVNHANRMTTAHPEDAHPRETNPQREERLLCPT